MRRLHLFRGRLVVYLEPKDIWVGMFVGDADVFVCPLPCVVFRWTRQWWWDA